MASRSRPLPIHPNGSNSSNASSVLAAFLQPSPPSPSATSSPVSSLSIASTNDKARSTSPTPPTVLKPSALPIPPPLTFDVPNVSWSGLTLEEAQYTLTSHQLQDVVSRAIRSAAEESSIRLLPPSLLDADLPAELVRLETLRLTTQAQYRFLMHRRTMLLQSLHALSSASVPASSDTLYALTRQLAEISVELDKLALQLITTAEQRAQIAKLLDVHAMSALGMALRKLNKSFAKRSAELSRTHARVKELEEALHAKEEVVMGEIQVGIEPGHKRMDSQESTNPPLISTSDTQTIDEPAKEQQSKRPLSLKTQLPPVQEEEHPPSPVDSTEPDQLSRSPPRDSVIPVDATSDDDDDDVRRRSQSSLNSPPASPIDIEDGDTQVIMISITGRAIATQAKLTTSPPPSGAAIASSVHSRSSSKSSLKSRLAATPDQAQSQGESVPASPTVVESSGSTSPVPLKEVREHSHVPPLQIQKLRGKQQTSKKGMEKRKKQAPSALRVPATVMPRGGLAGYLASPRELIGLAFLTDQETDDSVDASKSEGDDDDDDDDAVVAPDIETGDMSIDVAEALMTRNSPRGGYQTLEVGLSHNLDVFLGTPALATGMSSQGSGRPHSTINVEDVLSASEGDIYSYYYDPNQHPYSARLSQLSNPLSPAIALSYAASAPPSPHNGTQSMLDLNIEPAPSRKHYPSSFADMDSDGSDGEDQTIVYEDKISKVYMDSHGQRRLVLKTRDRQTTGP